MSEKSKLDHWVELYNLRGIAGAGARENDEEKLIVERDVIGTFANTVDELVSTELSEIRDQEPPLPDFAAQLSGETISIELTEFIDPELLQKAKYIMKTANHPLSDMESSGGLWFATNKGWFNDLLIKTIHKKESKYESRQTKIDILLVWNEALQVGIEDTNLWLQDFELPELKNISSVYFQSWYHPNYIARPTWSIKVHPQIGKIAPTLANL